MAAAGRKKEDDDEPLETLKFNFSIESLGLVLYKNHPTKVSFTSRFPPHIGTISSSASCLDFF